VSVLSIDLALASYRDVGAALVQASPEGEIVARVIQLAQAGRPTADAVVGWIEEVAERAQVQCIAIDGPLGWRGPDTDSPHARLSERAVRAPGKTGLPPDGVKPRTYLEFSRLSMAIFEQLTARGWRLPADSSGAHVAPEARYVTETFPTAAWRALGLVPLAGKARSGAADVADGLVRLAAALPIEITGVVTHDDLQAVVGGIAPAWWMAHALERVRFVGVPPFRLDDSWREGFILVPMDRAKASLCN
jgi:hypothetical protein